MLCAAGAVQCLSELLLHMPHASCMIMRQQRIQYCLGINDPAFHGNSKHRGNHMKEHVWDKTMGQAYSVSHNNVS